MKWKTSVELNLKQQNKYYKTTIRKSRTPLKKPQILLEGSLDLCLPACATAAAAAAEAEEATL